MLFRAGCDQEPENCVRVCERSLAPETCGSLHGKLLDCYEATPASEFVCLQWGFQELTFPLESVCPGERDALIECAYPEVKQCLDVCRAVEHSRVADAGDAADGFPSGNSCPSYDIPCDSICWLGHRFLSDPDAGSASDAGSDATFGDAGLGEIAAQFIACALERAEACRSADAGADAGDANWSSVMRDCAEQFGLR